MQRILDGKQTLSQIAEELDVPQPDLLVWMAQQFDQKQQRIEQLSRTVEQLRELTPDQAKIETRIDLQDSPSTHAESFGQSDPSDIVEGRVN